ncbi:MAG: HDIG domain-containing protein [Gemmatimonadetes bacterium]|nr:HDIG domain-containing protein [Gemmatimonadota bacterium]
MSRQNDRNGGDSVLRRLSGEPGASWRERIPHHGARILLVVVLAGLVTSSFPPAQGPDVRPYEAWSVAPEDVIAEFPFDVLKTLAELEAEQNSVREGEPPTFNFVPEFADTMRAKLERFFDQLDSAVMVDDRTRVQTILQGSRITATASQVDFIEDSASREAFRASAVAATREILADGVVDVTVMGEVTTSTIYVREGDTREVSRLSEDIPTSRDFYDQAALALPPLTTPDESDLFRMILIGHMQPTYVLNVLATETRRDALARAVPPVKQRVLEGQAIVRQADPIGPETLERLQAYAVEQRARGGGETAQLSAAAVIGAGLLNVMLFSLFGLLLFFNRPEVYANFRWLLFIALLVSTYFAAAVAIDRSGIAAEWLPIAFVALPVAVLWDSRMALFLVLVLAAITGTLSPFASYGTVLLIIAAGAAAAMSVRAVRRRSETWVAIAIIAAAGGLMLLAYGLMTSRDMIDIAQGTAIVAGNATVSALLATGFLFVFELFTGITTDQTLLEWVDPTRPLLRRLSLEAPGTYAHTISVANLAETAATKIGANGLLTRVGVYYHDVGKILKPHYFVENQQEGRNPHDKLKPETSASIVREHVTEGVRLAKDAKVPDLVIQFILEHHGTQRIGFFYEKAGEEADGDIDEERFSYPGPKPQSRETAIAMLADSCESATRAMQDPTRDRVRDLIHNVVDGKISDRQLDDAPITLREIEQVKEQFVNILSGVLHRRIEYPSTRHLTDSEEGNGDGAEPDASQVADIESQAADSGAPA